MKRNIYLSNIELSVAKNMLCEKVRIPITEEEVMVHESFNRVTSEAVFARISSPYYNASAMDGICVKSSSTLGADASSPKRLKKNLDYQYIDTGEPIIEPYNSVIMIEDINELDDNTVEIIQSTPPWAHIRPVGEDIVQGEMIASSNHLINGVDIGALLAGGIEKIKVYKKIRVGIIPTGTEIIEPWEDMQVGKIIDSNSRMLEALVTEAGGVPRRYEPVEDDYEKIKDAVQKGIEENDMVLINAGSSAGREDYTSHIIKDLGEILFHGIAIKPGKPTMAGIINSKAIIGIPGYPVSAFTAFEALVKPMIDMNSINKKEEVVRAVLSKRVMSSLKYEEFMRIKLGNVGGKLIATPLNRGAGVTMSLVRSDGIAIIPKQSEGLEASSQIDVKLIKDLESINNTVVSIGSHDMIMDIITEQIHSNFMKYSLASSHVGSQGGIMAIKRGEAHIAPIHILNPLDGVYNIGAIQKYLSHMDIVLIRGVGRSQGLMVHKGNPKKISSIMDLNREDVVFVNRQRGSGTRILLDYKLSLLGLDKKDIVGYDREMTTHLTVASAVKSNTADTGLGVKFAAIAMGLDFIPIGNESYDFVIPKVFLDDERVRRFIETLKSEEFKLQIQELEGYNITDPGEIIYDSTWDSNHSIR